MSEFNLYFLARSEQFKSIHSSLLNLYQVQGDQITHSKTVIPNICIIEINFRDVDLSMIRSARHLNIRAINENAAIKLKDQESMSIEIQQLAARFEKIDNRENYSFLLELLAAESDQFSWLR